MKIRLLIFIFIFGLGLGLEAHADLCETLLAEPRPSGFFALRTQNDSDQTSPLITYLSRLLDETLIGDVHLVRLSEGLERGEVVNPISEVEAADFRLSVQRSGLEYLIQSGGFDPDALLTWAKEKLSERGIVRVQREIVREDTERLFTQMQFVFLQPGEFWMGKEEKRTKVGIESPFEMSVFQVTQWQWAMVMGSNPSHFNIGANMIIAGICERSVQMQPDHPVEQVSWEDVQLFLEKLNELSKANSALIYEIIPEHSLGKIYRLPKKEEWEYATKAGTDTKFSFGDDETRLNDYAWFRDNSRETTHAVGLKLPNPWGLYDVHGNVWEWVQDGDILETKDGSFSIPVRMTRGGAWDYDAHRCASIRCASFNLDYRSKDVGFRLVRTDAK